MLKRADGPRVSVLGVGQFEGGDFAVLYPNLWDHLTQTSWDDGSNRMTSSLTLFADAGQLKAVLKDKNFKVCLWMAAPGPESLFGLLDAALLDPMADWRLDRQDNGGSSKRVKGKGSP